MLWGELHRAYLSVTSQLDKELTKLGVTSNQYYLLQTQSEHAFNTTELAYHLGLHRTTISRNMQPLERKGLVVLRRSSGDLRKRFYMLTEQGEDVVKQGASIWNKGQSKICLHLLDSLDSFYDMLRSLIVG